MPGLYGSAKEGESQEREGMDYPMPGSVRLGKKKAAEEGPWKEMVIMFLGRLAMENLYDGPDSERPRAFPTQSAPEPSVQTERADIAQLVM